MRTHYDNLQVSRTASPEVIRASYRTLIQKYHPDRFPDKTRGAQITQIINNAYAVLGEPSRRSQYDAWLEALTKRTQSSAPTASASAASDQSSRAPRAAARTRPASDWGRNVFIAGAIAIIAIVAAVDQRRAPSFTPRPNLTSIANESSVPAVLKSEQSAEASVGVMYPSAAPPPAAPGLTVYSSTIPSDLKKGSRVRIVFNYTDSNARGKHPSVLYKIEEPQSETNPGPTLIEQQFTAGIYKIYSKSRRIAPLKITLPHTNLVYFLKLMDTTSGKVVMSMMARGGQVLEVKVPLGTFRLRYAYGPIWYGENNKFGEETLASEADADLSFLIKGDLAAGHEIELVQQLNGNLKEKSLDPALF